jgi:glycosyltransferase involved in cell wall biosynthesis
VKQAQGMTEPMIEAVRNAWKGLPLPAGARRAISPAIWGGLDRFFEMRLRRRAHDVLPGSAKVAGFFSESHGIAASAKRCADAFEALGVETQRVDLGALTHANLLQRPTQRLAPGGAWIFHVNPPELVVALASIGADAFARSFLAGYWAWELPEAPPLWLRRKALVDEVWAPSLYTADALRDEAAAPLRVVPHPIPLRPLPDRSALRATLGLPADMFIATTLFDFRSSLARKNPLGAIAAFRKAFADDSGTLLVVKSQRGDTAPVSRAELAQAASAANIRLIDEAWPIERAEALIGAADVLISLHRAEGFGLPLAEAMALGTPVVATNWSGNVDFMQDYDAKVSAARVAVADAQGIYAGQTWAEPDIDAAAALLSALRNDEARRHALSQRGRQLVQQRLGLSTYRAALGDAFWAAIKR